MPEFLEHARSIANRRDWRFQEAEGLTIPAEAASADMVCFFSVMTHLRHEESYLYLKDSFRVLKPGGRVVISFLEFRVYSHWAVFNETIERRLMTDDGPLNQFVSRDALSAWAHHIGFTVEQFWDGDKPFVPLSSPVHLDSGIQYETEGTPGQSVCLMTKPAS